MGEGKRHLGTWVLLGALGWPSPATWPVVDVARKVLPSVVGIVCEQRVAGKYLVVRGAGSGVVYDTRGDVVTNYHVVAGADALRVILPDGRRVEGRVVGTDPPTDLAVVRVHAQKLVPARWADISRVAVGQLAVAVGNPLGPQFGPTVTAGVVSGINRSLGPGYAQWAYRLIQTDAAINPGNSGGALADADGRVLGINSVKVVAPGFEGMGFAIPGDTVRAVVDQLLSHGEVMRPWLGVAVLPAEVARRLGIPVERGLVVDRVERGSPAEKAGVLRGDVLVAAGDRPLQRTEDLLAFLASHRVGERVSLRLQRDGREREVQVFLGVAPRQLPAAGER